MKNSVPTPFDTDFIEITNYAEATSFITNAALVLDVGHTPTCDLILKSRGRYHVLCDCGFMNRLMDSIVKLSDRVEDPRVRCELAKLRAEETDAHHLKEMWFKLREDEEARSLIDLLVYNKEQEKVRRRRAVAHYWREGWTRVLGAITSPIWAPLYLLFYGFPKPIDLDCEYYEED